MNPQQRNKVANRKADRRSEKYRRGAKTNGGDGTNPVAKAGRLLHATAHWRYFPAVAGMFYLLVAGAVTVRYHRLLDYGMESDFLFEYVPAAREIASGTLPIPLYRGPVYPLLLAGLGAVTRDYFRAGLLISIVAAAVTVALSCTLIRKLFNAEIALAVAPLMIANPAFFLYTYQVGTDMLFAALVSGCMYLLLTSETLPCTRLALSAMLAALAYLTRYNGIFILAVPFILVLPGFLSRDWPRRAMAGALFAGVFFACITPWGLYCFKQKGRFFYSENQMNIAFEVYGRKESTREEFFWREENPFRRMSLPRLLLHDPPVFLRALARNFWSHGLNILKYVVGWPMALLAGVGLLLILRGGPTFAQSAYLLLNFAFFLVLLPIHFEIRYPLFLLAALLALAMCGLFLWNRPAAKRWRPVSSVVLAGLVAYAGVSSYRFNRWQIDAGPKEVLDIAAWLKAHAASEKSGMTIAARKPHIAYYSGLEYAILPLAGSPEELIRILKRQKVRYLYFGPIEDAFRPELGALRDPNSSWPGLKRLVATNDPASVLYEVE
jgi:4-amino-4-deoxy-L-arabinose transferase-like glycosyltransferase